MDKEFYQLWLERMQHTGIRHPKHPFRTLPPSHPLSKLKIDRVVTELQFLDNQISLEVYQEKMLNLDKKMGNLEKELT